MKRIQQILADINKLTLEIEQDYPELYSFLDENPLTISTNQKMDVEIFQDYLDTIQEQLEKHKESH